MDPYAAIAPYYDPVSAAFLRGPRERMAAVCEEQGAKRVLDMGCGTGRFLEFLQGRVPMAVGLDISAAMLARRKRESGGPSCVVADGLAPPFAPGSFDIVTCCLLLHECGDKAEALLALSLTLAPQVLVLEWRMPERNLDYLFTFWVHGIERLAGAGHYRSFRRFMRQGGINGLAQRCGARRVTETALAGGSLVMASFKR